MREEKDVIQGTKSRYLLPFKSLTHFSHQSNSKNNDTVLLSKGAFTLSVSLARHSRCNENFTFNHNYQARLVKS